MGDKVQLTPLDQKYLDIAFAQAQQGLSSGGIPIGSALRRGDQLLGKGHNQRIQQADPVTHAEIDCLRNARRQRSYRDTVLYSTLMPCYLCAGAVVQFGIPRVVVGEDQTFPGALEFMRNNDVEVVIAQEQRCIAMMRDFINHRPELWFEDIGHEPD